jgi:D-glycero-alpha-D-manno-heptose-7-phosphate kinase
LTPKVLRRRVPGAASFPRHFPLYYKFPQYSSVSRLGWLRLSFRLSHHNNEKLFGYYFRVPPEFGRRKRNCLRRVQSGFTMTTESEAPAGAGLAGSSTLNIACIGALNHLVGNRYAPEKFIPIAANVETQVIKVPAGFQDYYSAQYGGAACIHFRPDGIEREALDVDAKTLEDRIVVLYTGEPRNSGTNNWEITKRHIDGDIEIFAIFEGIRDTSQNLREALLASDWTKTGEILKSAYPQRKRLSPNITTAQMDLLIAKAEANGAIAAKVCGAGGGGCIAFFCEENRKSDVENALAEERYAEVLQWRLAKEGLVVNEN